jgi:hypothetical protein
MTPSRSVSQVMPVLVTTGLIAGTLDACAASLQFYLRTGRSPDAVFRYVASALVTPGPTPGAGLALVGLAMHYAIAMGWTVLFFVLAARVAALRGNPWVIGTLYGLFVWVMMNRVLVPLTRIGPPKSFDPVQAAIGAGILVVCIGIPIAHGARRAYGR